MLETERLILRPFAPADFDPVYDLLYADASVADLWTGGSRAREDVWERFMTAPVWRLERGFGFRAIVRKDDQAVLGLMGFQRFEPAEDTSYVKLPADIPQVNSGVHAVEAELTYAIGRVFQRHGYATEAGQMMIAHGFDAMGIERIVNVVDERNRGTIALMQRLGFHVVPNLRSRVDWPSVVGILTGALAHP